MFRISTDRIAFSEAVRFKAEPGLNRAVAAAARQSRTSSAEWMRRALRERLQADGITLPPIDMLLSGMPLKPEKDR